MYRNQAITVPASDTAGAAVNVKDWQDKWIYHYDSIAAVVTYQTSAEDVASSPSEGSFIALGVFPSGTTGRLEVPDPCIWVRAVTSSFASGTGAALIRGDEKFIP